MNAILFAVAKDIELDPLPPAGIDGLAIRLKIDGDLNEPAVVFETDVTPHANGRSARHGLAHHRPVGDATHHTVGEQLPAGADRRDGRLTTQIVNHVRLCNHGLASRRADGDRDRSGK